MNEPEQELKPTPEAIAATGRRRALVLRIAAAGLLVAVLVVLALAAAHRLPFGARPAANTAATPAPANSNGRRILYWYDPMHPNYTSPKPGIAPDCGMELVPRYAEDESAHTVPGTVVIPEDKQSLAGVRTALVAREPASRELRTSAVIAADEDRIAHVHVKFSGVIDQVYTGAVGDSVQRGRPLFTIYSPDLLATEQEFLLALSSQSRLAGSPVAEVAASSRTLVEAARERLSLWDITPAQIHAIEASGHPLRTLAIPSPASGYIVDRKAYPHAAVTPDTELYTISDLSTVWALVDIYEDELPYVRPGQRVALSLSYDPTHTYAGTIAMIYPTIDPQSRTAKARVVLSNRGLRLKPQMYADARIHIDYGRPIVIPREAVLDAGSSQQVYVVEAGSHFVPRTVTLGAELDDRVVVLDGLKEGERIAISGNFLVDSESRLHAAADQAPAHNHTAAPAATHASANAGARP